MSLPPLPAMTWMQTYSKQQVKELMREYGQKCYEQGKADASKGTDTNRTLAFAQFDARDDLK